MSLLVRLALLLALALGFSTHALAREEIRAFASDVVLRQDGSVAVQETIDVNAEGVDIRRGIYRDIPVTLASDSGGRIRINLSVSTVTRDGAAEPFRVERMGDFQRIWIGDPDQFISRGEHRYVVSYVMNRMARSFADHDELYWNATGNYWAFPILKSVARVTLPQGAIITDLSAYTGLVGSSESAVTITRSGDNSAIFRTGRSLAPGEGMTFAVSFQKGIITYPEGVDAAAYWLSDMRDVLIPVGAVLLVLLYNFAAWWRVGRDPPKGTIIPLFYPPKGFSPGLAHYVHRWGFAKSGWTAMTAGIFALGVKGLVTISNVDNTLTVTATGKKPSEKLPVGEQLLFNYFSARGAVTIDKAAGKEIGAKRAEFTSAIESENRLVWFRNNIVYSVFSFVLAIGLLALMVVLDVLDPPLLILGAVIGIFAGVVGGMLMNSFRKGVFQKLFILVWAGIFLFNVGGGMLGSLTAVPVNSAAIAGASLILISVIFAVLMRAPTIQGRKVMDEIEGFKLYLETAEKNRLNIIGEPPMSIDRFERILPYAIALGVEKPWSEHFEAELARNAVADTATPYQPMWYSGSNFSSGGLSRAISGASAGMAAAMIAAQPVQASSSGSGGGGFSGGGGGGGGGGGW
ncbi:DUF2207 domain-containing protein [Devosia sp. PTR5]|uniref:DUF2207 domain-containing protein n=1 Tax=Devosia oryzisoli TaxID=2774138 RepID=A0A927FUM7_9HYPH|nr:DUF2207 domain-containing protein [Devosia oryzisoli]MBD8065459.1 DUF2207 domain-containing protein [Devosia oryzisoli]